MDGKTCWIQSVQHNTVKGKKIVESCNGSERILGIILSGNHRKIKWTKAEQIHAPSF